MVPLALIALVIAALFVPRIRPAGDIRLDWLGGGIIFLGLFGLAFGLMSAPGMGWDSPVVLSSLAGGAVALLFFIYFENRQPQPLVQLRIFRSTLVRGANLATLFLYFGLTGIMFFTVLNLQQVQGFTATESGLALLPPIVLITFLTGPSGALADKIGPRPQMILGPLLVSAGMAFLAVAATDADYLRHFLPGLALFGLGMATIIPPLTKSALSVSPAFSGSASGINNGVSRVAGLLAIAVLGVVMLSAFSARLSDAVSMTDLTAAQQTQILEQTEKLGGITIPDSFGEAARREATGAVHASFLYGFRWAMAVCAGLAFTAGIVSILMIKEQTPGEN